jgi:PAS domain S-box-containing protein
MARFALLVWVSFVLIIVAHMVDSVRAAQRYSELRVRNSARAFQEHADRSLDAADALLRSVVLSIETTLDENAGMVSIQAALSQLAGDSRQVSRLVFVDADGIVAASSLGPSPSRADVSGQAFFAAHRSGSANELAITPPARAWDSGAWFLGLSRRVSGPQGQFVGVVLALVDPAYFADFYRTWDLNTAGAIALVSPDGTVIAGVNAAAPAALYTGTRLQACALTPTASPEAGPLPTNDCLLDDRPRLIAQRPTEHGLIVLTGAAQADTRAVWLPEALTAFVLIVSISALIAGISILRMRELRQSETLTAQVQESERRFRDLYDLAPVGYHELDAQGRITRVNQTELTMLGYRAEEMLGRPIWDFVAESDDARRTFFDRLADPGPSRLRERSLIHKDGRQISAALESRPVTDAAGRVVGLRVTVQDITEYKRTQAELHRQEAEKALILSSMAEEVVFYDRDLRVLWTNRSLREDISQFTPAGAPGPFCFELFRDREGPCNDCPVRRALQTGELQEEEVLIAGGRWILSRSRPVRDAANDIIGAVEVVLDITERKRAENALRASEVKLRTIFDSLAEGVAVTDLRGRLTEVNAALVRLTGAPSRESLIGRSSLHYISGQCHDLARATFNQTLSDGRGYIESIFLNADGRAPFEAEATTARFDDADGRARGFVAIIRDVTERRRLENELRRAQKLEAVGILAGGIAHDFNNILTAILGNISLARVEARAGNDIGADLHAAERACLRARALTQQLLTFSRGGAPVRQSASMRELLHDTATFALRGSNTRCEFRIASDLWPANIDQGQISQVIQNLIINADQAMPGGGVITLVADNYLAGDKRTPTLHPGQRYVHIRITDQGVGIPPEIAAHIFDPYFTTKESGRGLGLATSYSIVHQHDGHISFASTVGDGATFNIYLPAAETPPATDAEAEPMPLRPGSALVMDDEEALCEVAIGLLNNIGFRARAVRDGSEMLDLYRQMLQAGSPFDVVLLDLTIPGGMGGAEAIGELLKLDPNARALVSSGYANAPIMANYADYGFVGVIAKPYRVEELQRVITAALKRSPAGPRAGVA